ncbi:MAG: hypothetical protein R3C12_14755 [Planctomycetaceae bacterium]
MSYTVALMGRGGILGHHDASHSEETSRAKNGSYVVRILQGVGRQPQPGLTGRGSGAGIAPEGIETDGKPGGDPGKGVANAFLLGPLDFFRLVVLLFTKLQGDFRFLGQFGQSNPQALGFVEEHQFLDVLWAMLDRGAHAVRIFQFEPGIDLFGLSRRGKGTFLFTLIFFPQDTLLRG